MKKSLIASAVAAAVLAGPASAMKLEGPDYGIEVNVDVGMYYLDSKGSESEFKGDGVNQIEIKGKRKVNDTITVFGEIELEYDPAASESDVVTDDAKVGIKHATLGTFTFGQFDSYYEDKVAEALAAEHGDTGKVEESAVIDDDNRMQWKNKFGDTTVAIDLSYDKASGDEVDIERSIALKQKMGDISFTIGAGKEKNERDNMGANLTYKVDDTKFVLSYVVDENADSEETSYAGFLVTQQFGSTDIFLAAQNVDDDGTENTDWAVGVGYEVAKDMLMYADFVDRASQDEEDLEIGIKYEF